MHKAKKYLGQNFLKDANTIIKIINYSGIKKDDYVIEIGPGLGALTTHILKITQKLQVIEYDKDLIPSLENICTNYGKLKICHQDVLNVDFNTLYQGKKIKLIGNLPYNISSPLLFHLIDYNSLFTDMTFLLQKELVDKIVAAPCEKNYGRLSIILQYHFKCEGLSTIPANFFHPKPKVESRVIRLTPHTKLPYIAKDYSFFSKIVKQAFTMRRKTLKNNLKKIISLEKLQQLPIDLNLRPENLSVLDFVNLSNYIRSATTDG